MVNFDNYKFVMFVSLWGDGIDVIQEVIIDNCKRMLKT